MMPHTENDLQTPATVDLVCFPEKVSHKLQSLFSFDFHARHIRSNYIARCEEHWTVIFAWPVTVRSLYVFQKFVPVPGCIKGGLCRRKLRQVLNEAHVTFDENECN